MVKSIVLTGALILAILVGACGGSEAGGSGQSASTTDQTPSIDPIVEQLILSNIMAWDGVREAEYRYTADKEYTLVIIVDWWVDKEYGKDLADNFVRGLKSHGPDSVAVESGSKIGPGDYNYFIGVFFPDGTTQVAQGEKYDFADNIKWFD